MAYIGNTVQTQGFAPAVDYFSGNGVTVTFTLSRPVASVAQLTAVIDNVIQNPSSAFTVSGNQITFTSAPLSGTNNIWVEYTSLVTTYAAISQDPSVIGDITASGGYLSTGDFGNSYIDGTIVDYVTGNSRITTGPADGLTIYNGGTTARTALTTWTAAGNVGIGTTSPTNFGTNTHGISIDGTGNYQHVTWLANGVTVADAYTNGASGFIFGTEASAPLQFQTVGVERMRLDASGNLGIGSTSPNGKLQLATAAGVENTMRMTGSTTAASFINQSNTGGNLYFGLDNSAGTAFGGSAYSGNIYHGSAYPLIFWTSAAERMRIDSSGYVMAGVTSAVNASRLSVSQGSASNAMFVVTAGNGNRAIGFTNVSTFVGDIVTNSSSVSYNTSSDYRLKEDIAPMTDALSTISALKPVTYKWKATGEASQGFIAHELAEVMPDCVTGEKDAVDEEGNPKYQGIDTSFLVATLTAAIQEQQALITSLTARIEALESK